MVCSILICLRHTELLSVRLEHSSGHSSDDRLENLPLEFGFKMTVGNILEFWVRKIVIENHKIINITNYTAIVIILIL